MNNGGGDREWLLSHLRSDLTGTFGRCILDSRCHQLVLELGDLSQVLEMVSTFQSSLEYHFDGLPESTACEGSALPLKWEGSFSIRSCIPSLYQLDREEMTRHFMALLLEKLASSLGGIYSKELTEQWAQHALGSLSTGEVLSDVSGSLIEKLHWHAVRADSNYSELLISTDQGASDALSRHFVEIDACDTPNTEMSALRFSRWLVQQVSAQNWVVTVPFSLKCGATNRTGEAIWEIDVQSIAELKTTRVLLRNLRDRSP